MFDHEKYNIRNLDLTNIWIDADLTPYQKRARHIRAGDQAFFRSGDSEPNLYVVIKTEPTKSGWSISLTCMRDSVQHTFYQDKDKPVDIAPIWPMPFLLVPAVGVHYDESEEIVAILSDNDFVISGYNFYCYLTEDAYRKIVGSDIFDKVLVVNVVDKVSAGV